MDALGGWLDMWSESLGGMVNYLDGEDQVTFFARETVTGSDPLFDGAANGDVALYGWFQCLASDISQSEGDAGTVYLEDSFELEAPHNFTFNQDDLTLYNDDGDSQVGLAEGVELDEGPYRWGLHSGPLVTNPSSLTEPWEAWGSEVFYTYETGHNHWNRYTAIVDSLGEFVSFDPPMQFLYEHTTANDINGDDSFNAQSFFMHYNGPGDLWGIPHAGDDLDGDGEPDRWFPQFSIADGVLVGPTGTEFLVRPMELEQTLLEDPGAGGSLDLSGADGLTLPSSALYEMPDIGMEPVVTGPPAVINGVVQDTDE